MALPAFVSGPIGVVRVQALGVPPAPHLRLAARCVAHDRQRASGGHLLALQDGAQIHRRSRRVAQDHTKRIATHTERGSLLERCPHALALRIASVGSDDIPWSQGAMLQRCAGVDIADQPRATL